MQIRNPVIRDCACAVPAPVPAPVPVLCLLVGRLVGRVAVDTAAGARGGEEWVSRLSCEDWYDGSKSINGHVGEGIRTAASLLQD